MNCTFTRCKGSWTFNSCLAKYQQQQQEQKQQLCHMRPRFSRWKKLSLLSVASSSQPRPTLLLSPFLLTSSAKSQQQESRGWRAAELERKRVFPLPPVWLGRETVILAFAIYTTLKRRTNLYLKYTEKEKERESIVAKRNTATVNSYKDEQKSVL